MRGVVLRNQEDDYEEESPSSVGAAINVSNNAKIDGKNMEKVNAMRSKHSVTEQKRRSKINERFQILRDLIPHSEQKRDTASFLLEVIEYVQFLQDKVQKYEGTFQNCMRDTSKLMPWKNSHWGAQSNAAYGSAPEAVYHGKPEKTAADPQICGANQIAIEGGTICIASAYSEELLSTLTRALESAGVDLSQASISVQVDVGNRADSRNQETEHARKRTKT